VAISFKAQMKCKGLGDFFGEKNEEEEEE